MLQRFAVALLLMVSLHTGTVAQSLNHAGVFPTVIHSGTLSEKWSYSLYYFGAFNLYNDEVNGLQEEPNLFVLYGEQAISYNLGKGWSVAASYVYERQRPFATTYRNENRLYLQTAYEHNAGKSMLKQRLRFDGRFIQNRATGETPFTHRLRYQTGITTPIGKKDKYYFTAYNEFFFDTHKGANPTYSEDWAYAALGYKTGNAGTIEAGPLYIFWVLDNINTRKNMYYLQLSWITHIDYRKNKNKNNDSK